MRTMTVSGGTSATHSPLAGQTLFLVGRVHGVTRRRLDQLVRARGAKLVSKPSTRITAIAVAHSAASAVLPDGRVRMPAGLPASAAMIGELELRRQLGLLRPPEAVDRTLGTADLERITGLTRRLLACLALFDVLEPADGLYSYRDLVAAREAGRLLAGGVELRRVLEAAIGLRRRGLHLAETRLAEGPSGNLLRELSGQLAELNGQFSMRLDHEGIDDVVAKAEEAEDQEDHATAETLYTTALRADSSDPVIPFNLGNVFDAQGRPADAKIAWQIAIARDPAFAEAWYNLALAAEDEAHSDLAIAEYRRAVQARPDFADAHFNLGLLLTKLDRFDEALVAWDRYLELAPDSTQAATAKRAAALCRMKIKEQPAKTGSS
jgi:tetratricopeptide (TPR) repeat protein